MRKRFHVTPNDTTRSSATLGGGRKSPRAATRGNLTRLILTMSLCVLFTTTLSSDDSVIIPVDDSTYEGAGFDVMSPGAHDLTVFLQADGTGNEISWSSGYDVGGWIIWDPEFNGTQDFIHEYTAYGVTANDIHNGEFQGQTTLGGGGGGGMGMGSMFYVTTSYLDLDASMNDPGMCGMGGGTCVPDDDELTIGVGVPITRPGTTTLPATLPAGEQGYPLWFTLSSNSQPGSLTITVTGSGAAVYSYDYMAMEYTKVTAPIILDGSGFADSLTLHTSDDFTADVTIEARFDHDNGDTDAADKVKVFYQAAPQLLVDLQIPGIAEEEEDPDPNGGAPNLIVWTGASPLLCTVVTAGLPSGGLDVVVSGYPFLYSLTDTGPPDSSIMLPNSGGTFYLWPDMFEADGIICAEYVGGAGGGGGEVKDIVAGRVEYEVLDWYAYAGGQADTSLNPPDVFKSSDFGFSGPVDWDLSSGGIAGIIEETGSSYAYNLEEITVHYGIQSPTANEADTVSIAAKAGAIARKIKVTTYTVKWQVPNTSKKVHSQNALLFPDTASRQDKAGFVWAGENDGPGAPGGPWPNADLTHGKVEMILEIKPSWIQWNNVGKVFQYSMAPPKKGAVRLQREGKRTAVGQGVGVGAKRAILDILVDFNDADWDYDGHSDIGDAQHPTAAKPNLAFRLDWPGFQPSTTRQVCMRLDFREVVEHWNIKTGKWVRISPLANSFWYIDAESVPPPPGGAIIGVKGGSNKMGPGNNASNITNTKPVANPGHSYNMANSQITLTGAFSDVNQDTVTYKWTQKAGPNVTLSSTTAANPTFTLTTLGIYKFDLTVTDITKGLHLHNPNTADSAAVEVVIDAN